MEKPPSDFTGSPGEILNLAQATMAAWADPEKDPEEPVKAFAQLLEALTPARLISALPPARQAELSGRPVEELAAN